MWCGAPLGLPLTGKTVTLDVGKLCPAFVAGIGAMTYSRFLFYNVLGAIIWVGLLLGAGYWLGGLAIVQKHFSKVVLLIIVVSLLPLAWEWWAHRRAARSGGH